jgi:hypothetical protein
MTLASGSASTVSTVDMPRNLLAAGPDAYADWWPEPIEPEYLSTPHALARVMAETMLRREEAHWQQMLNGVLHPIAAAP